MKYAFIEAQRAQHSVVLLCTLLKVSRSGYYAWHARGPSARQRADSRLLIDIRRVHLEHREAYGSVKTWRVLNDRGIACGKHRVARLRRMGGVETRRQRRQRLTVEHHKSAVAAPDLLLRRFEAAAPNRVWAGDMTFIRTREGWLHLAVLLDLHSRKVVGWSTDRSPGSAVHLEALRMALTRRRPAAGLIHHTDRGPQYSATAYRTAMAMHGLVASMNGRKAAQDNAVAESFFSTLKNELVHHEDFRTRAEASAAIGDYIETFYNRKRLHQTLGYRTPEQIEQQWRSA